MAMLAHGSILVNLFTGFGEICVALVIWLVKPQKSFRVGLQVMQALNYQILTGVILATLFMISVFLTVILIDLFIPPFAFFFIFSFILFLAVLAFGVFGVYCCYLGFDFRYWWLGDFLASQQTKS